VRASDRLTDSAVCLVAAEHGPDRQLERLLAGAGRITTAAKPILEVNPRHPLIVSLSGLGEDDKSLWTTPRISCSTKRGSLMASARPTPVVSPTAWRACRDAGCAPRGKQPAGASGPTLPYGTGGVPCFLNTASIAAWAHFSPSALDTPIEPITSPSSTIGNAPGCGKSCINVGARF
jgi:hypothetical protein